MPKMPKSHDQPLCAYLMRYDAHIQSHPRSSPKWYICQKKKIQWKQFKLSSGHQALMTEHPGSLSLKALAGKLTSGMPKMPKSHDKPLYAYLMRYEAHIQSHPRSSPKWYICQKNWNPMKRIQVIIRTPKADDLTDGQTDGWMDEQGESSIPPSTSSHKMWEEILWSLGMDEKFHTTLYIRCSCLSVLIKGASWQQPHTCETSLSTSTLGHQYQLQGYFWTWWLKYHKWYLITNHDMRQIPQLLP